MLKLMLSRQLSEGDTEGCPNQTDFLLIVIPNEHGAGQAVALHNEPVGSACGAGYPIKHREQVPTAVAAQRPFIGLLAQSRRRWRTRPYGRSKRRMP